MQQVKTDLTDNKVSDEEHGNDNEPRTLKTATISIEGPKDVGVILESTIVVLGDNDTVFDITKSLPGKEDSFVIQRQWFDGIHRRNR